MFEAYEDILTIEDCCEMLKIGKKHQRHSWNNPYYLWCIIYLTQKTKLKMRVLYMNALFLSSTSFAKEFNNIKQNFSSLYIYRLYSFYC